MGQFCTQLSHLAGAGILLAPFVKVSQVVATFEWGLHQQQAPEAEHHPVMQGSVGPAEPARPMKLHVSVTPRQADGAGIARLCCCCWCALSVGLGHINYQRQWPDTLPSKGGF